MREDKNVCLSLKYRVNFKVYCHASFNLENTGFCELLKL